MEFVNYTGDNTPVTLGHFGLTVIRAEVFRDLPHPWFWSMPNPDTLEWDSDGHCDADITFWRMCREYGFHIAQRNDIVIGHIINAIKWPSDRGRGVILQPEEAYYNNGKPPNAKFNAELYKPKSTEEVKP